MRAQLRPWIIVLLPAIALCACKPAPHSPTATSNDAATVSAAPPLPAPQINNYAPLQTAGMLRIDDKAYFLSTAKWTANTVPVCWEPGSAKGVERSWVQDAVAKSWTARSALRFGSQWPDCAANAVGIRIAVNDEGPHTIDLGRFIDGKPRGMVLNFTFATWSQPCAKDPSTREMCIRSIAVHEFGHAIGFAHEQNRPDTPGECAQPAQGRNGDEMLTPWDPHSVMNYCNPVYNNNGVLSDGDIAAVQKIYGA